MASTPDLLSRLRRVEALRESVLESLAPLDPATLRARPAPDSWSLLEIVEHLVRAEALVLGPGGDGVEGAAERGAGSRILYGVVWTVLRLGIPVGVPADAMRPRGDDTLQELAGRWRARHAGLRRYLAEAGPEMLHRPVFAHPVIGSLRPREALVLGELHLRRHQGQLRRTREVVTGRG